MDDQDEVEGSPKAGQDQGQDQPLGPDRPLAVRHWPRSPCPRVVRALVCPGRHPGPALDRPTPESANRGGILQEDAFPGYADPPRPSSVSSASPPARLKLSGNLRSELGVPDDHVEFCGMTAWMGLAQVSGRWSNG